MKKSGRDLFNSQLECFTLRKWKYLKVKRNHIIDNKREGYFSKIGEHPSDNLNACKHKMLDGKLIN